MRFVVGLLLAILSGFAGARPVELVDEPQGLALSAADVEAATGAAGRSILEQERAAGHHGCETRCAEIAAVWRRIAAAIRRQQSTMKHVVPIRLHVVQTAAIDAEALPDGLLLLSETFVRERELNPAELAFVIAHEASHVLLQHERQTLTAALALLPHEVRRDAADVYVELDFNLALMKKLEPVMQQVELEADELGLLLASDAGFRPEDQLLFMARELAAEKDGEHPIVATHPRAGARFEHLRQSLPLALGVYERGLGVEGRMAGR